ncbi:hypothetical protein Plhal710r2_c064g0173591 [Plasmopara halstedii]
MSTPKVEKTVHGELELQPPPGQDANGISVGKWSSPVIPDESEGLMTSNISLEVCCPCIPLAQIEIRMGIQTYTRAISWYATAYGILTFALGTFWLFATLWICSKAYRDATSILVRILVLVGSLVLAVIMSLLLMYRISMLRSTVRERFDIPGSVREDRTAAWQETARAIRQMRRHLKIDQAKYGAVATLPAYVSRMMRCLDKTIPMALEGLQQRRETKKRLQEIDNLLNDDLDELPARATVNRTTQAHSFGSGRSPRKNRHYWVSKGLSTPGPGTYAVTNADSIVKTNGGTGGALGPRCGGCCRFQPCECKKSRKEAKTQVNDSGGKPHVCKEPRHSYPSVVVKVKTTKSANFRSEEQQRRVAAVQAAKERWKRVGQNMTPNYCWTERRVATGGALSMEKSTSRDGYGNNTTRARLQKLLIADRKKNKLNKTTHALINC